MKTVNKPDISVIIPIYNSEDSILRCLSSVQDQTFNNIEIICIDDCSSDNSNRILKELALKDERIIILENEKNVGPGVSRNKGIDTAKGDYLMFVDADDYIDDNLLQALYDKAISGSFDIISGDQKYKSIYGEIISFNRRQRIEKGLSNGKPLWVLFRDCHHGVLYRRTLFDDEHVRYGSTTMSEDSLFLLKVGHKTNSMVFLEKDYPCYYRVQNLKSLTNNSSNEDSLNELIKGIHEVLKYIEYETDTDDELKYVIYKILYLLSIHRNVSSYSTDTHISHNFLKALRKEAKSFPGIELIKNKNYIIKVLVDYEVNLTIGSMLLPRTIKDTTYFKNGIKEWVMFTKKHPELKKEWYFELMNVLTKRNLSDINKLGLINDKNSDDEYSQFLENEIEKCTSYTKLEKIFIKTISYFRTNENVNTLLSIIRRNINKKI